MKAIVYYTYGSADVLQCKDIEKPVPRENEVLIQVRAASVNPLDCGELKGLPSIARLIFGLRKPDTSHPGRPGVDVAGVVEAVGTNVTQFKPSDAVFGVCVSNPQAAGIKTWVHDQGAFAEYVCAPESALARKPDNVTFEQAAAAPVAALTALQALRDKGHVSPGHKVLINGAAGGVGTFAVQVAKSLGAEVTGVCSSRNLDTVRSLGADRIIDYTKEDFTKLGQRYDVILDCISNHSLSACRRVLNPKGIYIGIGDKSGRGMLGILSRVIGILTLSWFSRKKFITFLARPGQPDILAIRDLMESGTLRAIIDRTYGLNDAPDAVRYLETGHARGKIVITLT